MVRKSEPLVRDINLLFEEYLAVCNEILEKHQDRYPFNNITSLNPEAFSGWEVDLAVYDEEPKGGFSLGLSDTQLILIGAPLDLQKAWRLSLSQLIDVTRQPDEYINHPEKLKLDWLLSKLES